MKSHFSMTMPAMSILMLLMVLFAVSTAVAQAPLPSIADPNFLTPIANPDSIAKFSNAMPVVKALGIRWDAITHTSFQAKAAPCQQDVLGTGHLTKLMGFGIGTLPVTYPGATIVTHEGTPISVEWINNLGFQMLVPQDPYIDAAYHMPGMMMNGLDYNTRTIANNGHPFVPHLHGGHTDSQSDGLPDQWWTELYHTTSNPYAKGPTFSGHIFHYDNTQESGTLWYHDHSHGTTRLAAYEGMAGFYFVRDANEDALIAANSIPSGDYEVEIAVQDKTFYPDGQLAWPNAPQGPEPGNIMQPEMFGSVIIVNGKAWPHLDVEPRQYRFRFLNGCDSRFLKMWLDTAGVAVAGQFKEIGSDGGMLPAPVALDTLLIGTGERYDVVVDFAPLAGKNVVLMNNAPTPYPSGDPVTANTALIMQFRVSATPVVDPVVLPASLRPAITPLVADVPVRNVLLCETVDALGRTMPMLGTVAGGKMPFMPGGMDMYGITESMKLNSTEEWDVYNTTMDAHPIHLHLVEFQTINHQPFTATQDPVTFALSNIAMAGPALPPDPGKDGWKDTQIMYPGEVTRIIAKFDKPGDYVWHCHILSHEEWDMMRLMHVRYALVGPTLTSPPNLGTGIPITTAFSWGKVTDAATYDVQVATDPGFTAIVASTTLNTTRSFTPSSSLTANTEYYWRVRAVNVDGNGPWSTTSSFMTSATDGPVHFVFNGTTGANATVMIPIASNPFLDGIPIVSGDEIGVYTPGNLCVGATVWTGNNNAVTVWADNALTTAIDGMAIGEQMHYRLWKRTTNLEYIGVTVTYTSGNGLYADNSIHVLSSFNAVTNPGWTQNVLVSPGWNMISSFMLPPALDMPTVSASVLPNLVLVKNNAGSIYSPPFSINTIGSWNIHEGYQFDLSAGDTMVFGGTIIRPETTPISLLSGWNIAGYLRYDAMQPDTALASISGQLVLAKNNFGNVYWPTYGINTIGSLLPGQGYQMYTNAVASLTYPANTLLPTPKVTPVMAPLAKVEKTHFTTDYFNTGANATVLLRIAGAADGDEVAIKLQNGKIAGMGIVEKGKAVATVWGDNSETADIADGAVSGESLALLYWSASDQKEKYLTVSGMLNGLTGKKVGTGLTYETDGATVVDASIGSDAVTGVSSFNAIPKTYELNQNYPNPFNPTTSIHYAIPRDSQVKLEIFDILGARVLTVVDNPQTAGYYTVTFDASNLSTGVYFYRLSAGDFSQVKKMMLLK